MTKERGHTHRAPCGKPTTNSSLEIRYPCEQTKLSFAISPQNDQRPQDKLSEGRLPSLGQSQRHQQDYGLHTQGLPGSPPHGMTPMARFESEQRGNAPWSMLTSKHCQEEKNAEKTEKLRRQEEDIAFVGGMFDSNA